MWCVHTVPARLIYFEYFFVHSKAEEGLSDIELRKRYSDVVLQTKSDAQLYVNLQKCVIGVLKYPYWTTSWENTVSEQNHKRLRL